MSSRLPVLIVSLLVAAWVAAPAARGQDQLADQLVTITAERVPLSEVVSQLSQEAGVNVILHKEVQDEPVTLSLTNVSLVVALESIAAMQDLELRRIQGDVFMFSRGGGKAESDRRVVPVAPGGPAARPGGTVAASPAPAGPATPQVRLPAAAGSSGDPRVTASQPSPDRTATRPATSTPHRSEAAVAATGDRVRKQAATIVLKYLPSAEAAALFGQPAWITEMDGSRRLRRAPLNVPGTEYQVELGDTVNRHDRFLEMTGYRRAERGVRNLTEPRYSAPTLGQIRDQFGQEAGGAGGVGGPGGGAAGGAGGVGGGRGGQGVFPLPDGVDQVIGYDLLNSLLVYGTADGIAELRRLIEDLDQPPAQIDIEARFVSLTVNDADSLGINWTLSNGSTTVQGATPGTGATVALQVAFGNFQALLTAIERENRGKVVNAPRVATQNGLPAVVAFRQTVPVTISDTIITDASQTVSTQIESVQVTTQLFVVPRVTGIPPNESITTIIMPQVADIIGEVPNPSGGTIPIVAQEQIRTMLRVRDRETIAMGGLIRKNNREAVNKIPILGDLPFIGGLFRSRTRSVDESELLIFLTPSIIREPETGLGPGIVR